MPVAIFVIHNPFVFIQRYSGNFKAENFVSIVLSKKLLCIRYLDDSLAKTY